MNHPQVTKRQPLPGFIKTFMFFLLAVFTILQVSAQQKKDPDVIGRWDLTFVKDGKNFPSWLEVQKSGFHTLIGRYVYANGSARPISEVKKDNGKFSFSIPPQWEEGNRNLDFQFEVSGDQIKGSFVYVDNKTYNFTGVRAPILIRDAEPVWGEPITLFNGKNVDGWHTDGKSQWVAEDGVLRSPHSGANLISDQKFSDFKLHIEFRYPLGSNSGVYLRGRYEVQVIDTKSGDPEPINNQFSAIYGFLAPNQMTAKDPGEWQTYDITLVGRMVTIVANGKTVICNQIIPGITGGAIDSNEGEPGPILIQGDHGPIDYRNIIITPAK